MILDLNLPYDRQKFQTYCEFLVNKKVVVEVKEKKKQRSLSQNNYLHLLLGLFASEFGMDLESVKHDIFKKTVNPDTFIRSRGNKFGGDVNYLRSTADLDTGEMTLCIDRFRDWSSREAGLYLPEANEYEALIEAEKQIETCKRYL